MEEKANLPSGPESPDGNWITALGDLLSKIPEAYKKTFLAAGLRLVRGTADIAVAKLNAVSSEIISKQRSVEKFRDATVDAAAREIELRPDIREMAVNYYIDEVIGKQENRVAVVREAARELIDTTSSQSATVEQLDQDWLDAFSRYASDASSERLRILFGRILAGEVRRPGAVSLLTIDLLSKLGPVETKLISQVASYFVLGILPRVPCVERIIEDVGHDLADLGILRRNVEDHAIAVLSNDVPYKGMAADYTIDGSRAYVICSPHPQHVVLPRPYYVTKLGGEIFRLICSTPDQLMLGELADHLSGYRSELWTADVVSSGPGSSDYTLTNDQKVTPIKSPIYVPDPL